MTGFVVVNLASTNPPKTEADDLKETFLEFGGFEYSGVVIRNRVAFERALNNGLGITEYKPTDKKAQAEIRSFYSHHDMLDVMAGLLTEKNKVVVQISRKF